MGGVRIGGTVPSVLPLTYFGIGPLSTSRSQAMLAVLLSGCRYSTVATLSAREIDNTRAPSST